MKICIFGAGAIGGYMVAKLARAGAEVRLMARGSHLAAMQDKGLALIEGTRPSPCRSAPPWAAGIRGDHAQSQAIAEALGVTFPIDVERRIDGGAAVGAHRTSMLQDFDAGRPMEIDALVASVQELGRLTDLPTPTIDIVLALVRLRARVAGLSGA
jgi:ketopantoate reductase